MAKYSRTAKYQDLRNHLQNDNEAGINNNDLRSYESRLHRIDSNNFNLSQDNPVTADDHDPLHSRRQYSANEEVQPVTRTEVKTETPSISQQMDAFTQNPSNPILHGNENYTSAFNNEYMDEYIKEVKQYNVDHGNSASTSTDLNILKALHDTSSYARPSKPYADPVKTETKNNTANIPFFSNANTINNDFIGEEPVSDTRTMTKEDIASEVQNLLRGNTFNTEDTDTQPVISQSEPTRTTQVHNIRSSERSSDYSRYDDDRTARQQLLNETTQMRAQLDDYEDNLSEVSDKMRHTNRVLNVVLVILIVALTLVLALVVYWVLRSRGVF